LCFLVADDVFGGLWGEGLGGGGGFFGVVRGGFEGAPWAGIEKKGWGWKRGGGWGGLGNGWGCGLGGGGGDTGGFSLLPDNLFHVNLNPLLLSLERCIFFFFFFFFLVICFVFFSFFEQPSRMFFFFEGTGRVGSSLIFMDV